MNRLRLIWHILRGHEIQCLDCDSGPFLPELWSAEELQSVEFGHVMGANDFMIVTGQITAQEIENSLPIHLPPLRRTG
mgnify:CR=1 FL=1